MSDKNIHVKNISSAKVYISVPATRTRNPHQSGRV